MWNKTLKRLLLLSVLIVFALEMLCANVESDSVFVCTTDLEQMTFLEDDCDHAGCTCCTSETFGMSNQHILNHIAMEGSKHSHILKLMQDCPVCEFYCFKTEEILVHSAINGTRNDASERIILCYIHDSDGEKDKGSLGEEV